jgi:hypothetical protein
MTQKTQKNPAPKRKITFNGLERIRVAHHIPTRKELAIRLGLSELQTSKICRDATTSMSKETMEAVLNAFPDVSITDLIVEVK